MYGLPGDTLDGFKESLNYALSMQPNHLDVFRLSVIPGTELYESAASFSLNFLKQAPYTLISSPGFSEEDLAEAESLKNACDIFYNKGGAVGWMFMALEALEIEPSEFLTDFAAYLTSDTKKCDNSHEAITSLQSDFVRELFNRNKKHRLFPVMHDIIAIHGALNSSLYAGPMRNKAVTSPEKNSVLSLAPATRLMTLRYSFDDLMSVGELTFEEFLAYCRPQTTYLVIYNHGGSVVPLMVDLLLFDLLKSFNGEDSLGTLSLSATVDQAKEIYELIEYAIKREIVHVVVQ